MTDAMLPCFKCGDTLENVFPQAQNQPYAGTEFRTYGHYGSTFWDSFDGEELVLNICDQCLSDHCDRLAQHKRYLPVTCEGFTGLGRYEVDRPMVPYSGKPDRDKLDLDVEQLGDLSRVEWPDDIADIKAYIQENNKNRS